MTFDSRWNDAQVGRGARYPFRRLVSLSASQPRAQIDRCATCNSESVCAHVPRCPFCKSPMFDSAEMLRNECNACKCDREKELR